MAGTRGPSSCRIHLSVQGFEWFIYNRTAAYDNIIAQMQTEPSRPSYPNHDVHRHNVLHKDHSRSFASGRHYPPSTIPASSSVLTEAPSATTVGLRWIKSQLPVFEFSDFLPLSIDVANGAIVCGNASTPNLLVAEYKRAEGTFGVVPVCCNNLIVYSCWVYSGFYSHVRNWISINKRCPSSFRTH